MKKISKQKSNFYNSVKLKKIIKNIFFNTYYHIAILLWCYIIWICGGIITIILFLLYN